MKVKDLFASLEKEDILRAYKIMFDVCPSYEQVRYSVPELVNADKKFDEKASCLIDDIINAKEPSARDKEMVIFVIQLASEDYEDKSRRDFHSMAIYEQEFKEKAGKDFKVWTRTGTDIISHFAYDMDTLEEIAFHRIADQSIEECSAVVCAAEIFNEITFHGYDKIRRQENIEKLKVDLQQAIDESDGSRAVSAEDFFEEMHRDMLASMTDEDERRYYELEHDFDKSVEDIIDRWKSKVLDSNHQKVIDHIRAEWNRIYSNQ